MTRPGDKLICTRVVRKQVYSGESLVTLVTEFPHTKIQNCIAGWFIAEVAMYLTGMTSAIAFNLIVMCRLRLGLEALALAWLWAA